VPEQVTALEDELAEFISAHELRDVLSSRNKGMRLMANQSQSIKGLFQDGELAINFFIELEKAIKELLDLGAQ
jgi:putative membrane protein